MGTLRFPIPLSLEECVYLYILPLEKTCIYTSLLAMGELEPASRERGVGTLRASTLAHERQKDHQTNDLPHGLNGAGKGKELCHRGIPQELAHERNDRDRNQKRENRCHRILVHILFRGTGQIGHSLYTCAAHRLKHF